MSAPDATVSAPAPEEVKVEAPAVEPTPAAEPAAEPAAATVIAPPLFKLFLAYLTLCVGSPKGRS
jgi:hypothetical protein